MEHLRDFQNKLPKVFLKNQPLNQQELLRSKFLLRNSWRNPEKKFLDESQSEILE